MNTYEAKTIILSIIFMGLVISLTGVVFLYFKDIVTPNLRYFLPIPPIGVAAYVFAYNLFSKYNGVLPSKTGDLFKEIFTATIISSIAFLLFVIIIIFCANLVKNISV